ncbi:hypothetical protein DFH08DRAFT_318200 [Mycena albidolilacea]|uniref:Uncharacterized protein n=1 Tax=Mycena albidolilacea TaxID=1033008 RepID=A0AAD6ZMP9_9AGAR|nr:hypothetical protein DFH08DRAFT_318200 [Mycena albidolilacea]
MRMQTAPTMEVPCCGPRTRESTCHLGNEMSKGMKEKLRARRTRASVGREARHSPFVLHPSMLACPCALDPPAIAHFPNNHLLCSQTPPVFTPLLRARLSRYISPRPSTPGLWTPTSRWRHRGADGAGRPEYDTSTIGALVTRRPSGSGNEIRVRVAGAKGAQGIGAAYFSTMGARLNASEGMLPGSTERMLSVVGVADAIQITIYYIGNILIEAEERMPSSTNSSYLPSTNSRRQPSTHSGPSSLGRTNSTRSFSSPTPDELKTIIDSRFPRLVGGTA